MSDEYVGEPGLFGATWARRPMVGMATREGAMVAAVCRSIRTYVDYSSTNCSCLRRLRKKIHKGFPKVLKKLSIIPAIVLKMHEGLLS